MKVHPDTLTQGDTQTLDRGEFSGLYSDTPTQNDTQTRDVVSFGQHRSVVLEDPSFGDSLGDSSQLIGVLPTETSRPCLSQAVSKRLAKEKLTNQRLVRRPSNDEGEESTIAVRCQCGVSMQEGDEVSFGDNISSWNAVNFSTIGLLCLLQDVATSLVLWIQWIYRPASAHRACLLSVFAR